MKVGRRLASFGGHGCGGAVSCLIFVVGCAGAAATPEAPSVPAAGQAAVGKMLKAVAQAARPETRPQAITLLQAAVSEDPGLWEARYNLGVLLAQKGALDAARLELERAHELAPNAEDVVAALGEVLRRGDEHARAASVLTSFVTAYPGASQARRVLVAVLRESAQPEAAVDHARELLKQKPGDAAALAELALAHLEQRQVEVAELLIQEALEGEQRAVVLRAAGLIALQRGEDALAFVHFKRATELDPTDTAAGLNTATVLLQAGVYERAEKHFRAVLEVEAGSSSAKLGLAAALRGQGTRDEPGPYRQAEALLKEIVESAPEDWAAAHNLAVLYAGAMDRAGDAAREFSRFLSLAPPRHPAREEAQKWLDEHAAVAPGSSPRAQPSSGAPSSP